MKNQLISLLAIFLLLTPLKSIGCSMHKITQNGKTIVGNNEDWLSPNNLFWFENGIDGSYGVMYMGQLNRFAQGAINSAGLVFDGFANPELAVENTEGKLEVPIGDAVKQIMQTMSTAEEVKNYFEKINLSYLSSSQLVFVDNSGTYLIVEGDELILGEEEEKIFSNFYYSQIESERDVDLDNVRNGLQFMDNSTASPSLQYCSDVMKSMSSSQVFGTQYSTIYDLNNLKIRLYLFHDYSQYVELDLMTELSKGNRDVMLSDLFSKESPGSKHYEKYNNTENPISFLEELIGTEEDLTEEELASQGFGWIINFIGYEWLNGKDNTQAAITIFEYGLALMPNDFDLHDSLGEAYFENKEYKKSKLSYQKSLELNPDNSNAKKFIEKINSKKSD